MTMQLDGQGKCFAKGRPGRHGRHWSHCSCCVMTMQLDGQGNSALLTAVHGNTLVYPSSVARAKIEIHQRKNKQGVQAKRKRVRNADVSGCLVGGSIFAGGQPWARSGWSRQSCSTYISLSCFVLAVASVLCSSCCHVFSKGSATTYSMVQREEEESVVLAEKMDVLCCVIGSWPSAWSATGKKFGLHEATGGFPYQVDQRREQRGRRNQSGKRRGSIYDHRAREGAFLSPPLPPGLCQPWCVNDFQWVSLAFHSGSNEGHCRLHHTVGVIRLSDMTEEDVAELIDLTPWEQSIRGRNFKEHGGLLLGQKPITGFLQTYLQPAHQPKKHSTTAITSCYYILARRLLLLLHHYNIYIYQVSSVSPIFPYFA
ncbi:hypothetical protein GWK47_030957 [Chionoecetes opilio]|uniref:Uncharacterized protein n=1 Tax=Chionoecetes opilio TaxID=41210 RepID=A0A8J4YL53_CHIOP|nr:hypothetical protein GWK47_030957 [Chionoecetes opilio]